MNSKPGNVFIIHASARHADFLFRQAYRGGRSVLLVDGPTMLADLAIAEQVGAYEDMIERYASADVLIIDRLGTGPLSARDALGLDALLNRRRDRVSTTIVGRQPERGVGTLAFARAS